ncbi:TetR/AcrR family transcriptional regulator [Sessilibacter sp. MAH4]
MTEPATQNNKEINKKERILDSAEALFAQHGYDGVTIRQIAKLAEVDVALANYHFGKNSTSSTPYLIAVHNSSATSATNS